MDTSTIRDLMFLVGLNIEYRTKTEGHVFSVQLIKRIQMPDLIKHKKSVVT